MLVDGSQGAVHLDVDVRDLDADFYVVTGHKLYGPTGIGVLYGKRELLESLPPFIGGGEMIEEVTRDTVTYNHPPHRFEAGTPPIVQAIGLGAALDYMEGIGRARIRAHEEALSAYAHERLSKINSLRIIGTAPGKGPILSFTMQGAHAHDIATLIDRSGVAVQGGNALRHAAPAAVRRDVDLPRLVRPLQYVRGSRRARGRAGARPEALHLGRTRHDRCADRSRTAAADRSEAAVGDGAGGTAGADGIDRGRAEDGL